MLLDAICQQLLSYAGLREAQEAKLDAIKTAKAALKALERLQEEKLLKDLRR